MAVLHKRLVIGCIFMFYLSLNANAKVAVHQNSYVEELGGHNDILSPSNKIGRWLNTVSACKTMWFYFNF